MAIKKGTLDELLSGAERPFESLRQTAFVPNLRSPREPAGNHRCTCARPHRKVTVRAARSTRAPPDSASRDGDDHGRPHGLSCSGFIAPRIFS
jgi:hypothetical protein